MSMILAEGLFIWSAAPVGLLPTPPRPEPLMSLIPSSTLSPSVSSRPVDGSSPHEARVGGYPDLLLPEELPQRTEVPSHRHEGPSRGHDGPLRGHEGPLRGSEAASGGQSPPAESRVPPEGTKIDGGTVCWSGQLEWNKKKLLGHVYLLSYFTHPISPAYM